MRDIKARLDTLSKAVERMRDPGPAVAYEDLDPISQALVDYILELEALDTPEKKAAYLDKHGDGMSLEELEAVIKAHVVDLGIPRNWKVRGERSST